MHGKLVRAFLFVCPNWLQQVGARNTMRETFILNADNGKYKAGSCIEIMAGIDEWSG